MIQVKKTDWFIFQKDGNVINRGNLDKNQSPDETVSRTSSEFGSTRTQASFERTTFIVNSKI